MVGGFASGISDRCIPRRANLTVATKADRSERAATIACVASAERCAKRAKGEKSDRGRTRVIGRGKGNGIKSHPLPTPPSHPTDHVVWRISGSQRAPTWSATYGMERGEKKRRLHAACATCVCARVCTYRVKDENPLSQLTHHGSIFCNVDEPSRSTRSPMSWFVSNIIVHDNNFRDVKHVSVSCLPDPWRKTRYCLLIFYIMSIYNHTRDAIELWLV